MAEIRDVDDKGNVVEKEVKEVTTGEVLEVADDPLLNATEQVLGLETASEKARYASKLESIVEWAKLQSDDHTPDGIKWAIRDMQMKIGSPRGGESPIDYLYSYVALSSQKVEIDKKLRKYNPYE